MKTTHFRPQKRDHEQGDKARALARVLARQLKADGYIIAESIRGEYVTNADFETVQDLAYKLKEENRDSYSTAHLLIYETE